MSVASDGRLLFENHHVTHGCLPCSQQIWAAVLKYVIDAGKSSILEAAIGKPGDNKLVG